MQTQKEPCCKRLCLYLIPAKRRSITYAICNKELVLKAKGLLSQMLSLLEDWDYTLAEPQISRESIDAIRTAVWELWELEKAGYIKLQPIVADT